MDKAAVFLVGTEHVCSGNFQGPGTFLNQVPRFSIRLNSKDFSSIKKPFSFE